MPNQHQPIASTRFGCIAKTFLAVPYWFIRNFPSLWGSGCCPSAMSLQSCSHREIFKPPGKVGNSFCNYAKSDASMPVIGGRHAAVIKVLRYPNPFSLFHSLAISSSNTSLAARGQPEKRGGITSASRNSIRLISGGILGHYGARAALVSPLLCTTRSTRICSVLD